jgi:hypothetical protein
MNTRSVLLVGLGVAALALLAVLLGSVQDGRFLRLERGNNVQMHDYVSGSMPAAGAVTATAVLEAPRYVGQDLEGRNWEITATRATQTGAMETSSMLLEQVAAVWESPGEQPLTVQAEQAVYHQKTSILALNRKVQLLALGATLQAPSMTVVVASRTAVAEGGVLIKGRLGGYDVTLQGARLTADMSAEILRMVGGVKARLVPQ